MRLVRNSKEFPISLVKEGSIVTIGAFDGLHLGHQELLNTVLDLAANHNLPIIVMSFEPMPKEFFANKKPPARLMRFREKYDALKEYGINIFYCPNFNTDLQNIKSDTFIRQLLIHTLNMKYLVVGDDFHFAKNREGNLEQLSSVSKTLGFSINQVPSVNIGGERVSSTAIRKALEKGDLKNAKTMLGKNYRMSGKVIEGKKLGKSLGYPTANVNIKRLQSSVMGIFAVKVHGLENKPLNAVASLGTRPTFNGIKPLLEVYIFNFDKNIYGSYIHVDFIEKLREEKKFKNADALIDQMHVDAADARNILSNS